MSEYFWGAFFVITIIAFSMAGAGAIFKAIEGAPECKTNTDCADTSYCGSDLKCHAYPSIDQTIVKNDWTTPALVLGLSIVLAAVILKRKASH